jgi:predicted AAA+ superfamily ATPase
VTISDALLIEQNPWWSQPDFWEGRDPHLRRLAAQPVELPPLVADRVSLAEPAVHMVRGPRQVGKSTELKLLARRALAGGRPATDVLYVTLDLLAGETSGSVVDTVRRARELSRCREGALLMLDEVTAVRDWQVAVKYLWDTGIVDRDIVVCTGSSAIDLKVGAAERLPGRRGAGTDFLALPRSFAAFARAVDNRIPASPELSPAELAGQQGSDISEQARIHLPALQRALELYTAFGGMPAAVAEAAAGAPAPTEGLKRIVRDALAKEVARKGGSEPALRALLERVTRSLGSKVNWARMAREMDVSLGPARRPGSGPHGSTVRDYFEFLAAAYFLLVIYFWRRDAGSAAVSKDKKIYFADPLLHTVAHDLAPGLAVDVPALVENLVALALFRRCEPLARQAETFAMPDELHVWETAGGGEIDFVCGRRTAPVAVEVRYQRSPDMRKASAIGRALPGSPVLFVTRDLLQASERWNAVPAALALWALG